MLGWIIAGRVVRVGRISCDVRQWSGLRFPLLRGLVCGLLACVAPSAAMAGAVATAHFAGLHSTVNPTPFTSGLSANPVAVDPSGNVYAGIPDSGIVYKETLAANGTYTQTTLVSNSGTLGGLGADGAGNVYVALTTLDGSTYTHTIREYAPNGTYTTVANTVTSPENIDSIAVDAAGDVYILATGSSSSRILFERYNSGTYSETVPITGLSTSVYNIAVDTKGNLYFTGSSTVTKETFSLPSTYTETTPVTGLNSNDGITVDGAGNLYITQTTSNVVLKETYAAGSYTQTVQDVGFNGPVGIALDSSDNLYVANYSGTTVTKSNLAGINIGNQNVGLAHAAVTLTFIIDTPGTMQAPLALTQGTPGLDFTLAAAGGTCKTNGTSHMYSAGDTCTVNVVFKPRATGVRYGAVVLDDATFHAIATAYVYGNGVGPQAAFDAGIITTLPITLAGTGNSNVVDLKTDSAGTLYMADNLRCIVEKVPAGGGTATIVAGNGSCTHAGDGVPATSTGFNSPSAVAINGRGDLYISDAGSFTIRKVDAFTGFVSLVAGTNGTSAYGTSGAVATSTTLTYPDGLVLDGSGNLYLADGRKLVMRVDAATGILTTIAGDVGQPFGYSGDGGPALAAQLSTPLSIALDSANNLYIADDNNGVIRKVTASSGIITTVAGQAPNSCTHTGDGGPGTAAQLCDPESLAVDGGGNVYIADSSNDVIRKLDPSGIITAVAGVYNNGNPANTGIGGRAVLAGLGYTQAVTVDGTGNVYLFDATTNVIDKVTPASAVASFGNTYVSNASAAQDIKLINTGNAPLTLSGLASPANFNTSGADTTCTASSSLAAGASCLLGIVFSPAVAGAPLTGTITTTDNALFGSGSTQIVTVSGTGLPLSDTQTALTGVPATVTTGGNIGTAAVTLEDVNGNVVTLANSPVMLTITGPHNFTYTATANASSGVAAFNLAAVALVDAGNYTVTATSAGLTSSTATTAVADLSTQLTLTATPASTTQGTLVTLAAAATIGGTTPIAYGTVTFNYQETINGVTLTGSFGTGQLSVAGTSALPLLPGPGTYTVTATFAGTANENPATSAPVTLTIASLPTPYATLTTIASTGIPGTYTLTGSVAQFDLLTPATGSVNFVDVTSANQVLGTAPIDPATYGFSLVPAPATPVNTNAAIIVLADVNGDGIADAISIGYQTPTITVQFGLGNGVFAPVTLAHSYTIGSAPLYDLHVADVNGDGHPDILVSTGATNTQTKVYVLLGSVTGTFTMPTGSHVLTTKTTDKGFTALAVADLDGDGKLDVLVSNASVDTLSIFRGNGDGTFQAVTDIPVPSGTKAFSLTVGDLNQDGIPDLVLAASGSFSVDVFLGNGDGTFQAPSVTPVPINFAGSFPAPYSPTLRSLRNNGVQDLIVADTNEQYVDVFLGNNDGTFAAPVTYSLDNSPQSLIVSDLNHDGKLDMTVLTLNTQTGISNLLIFPGNGDGTFGIAQHVPAGLNVVDLVSGDLNNDGLVDFMGVNNTEGLLPIFLGAQVSTATAANVAIPGPTAQNVNATYLGDGIHAGSVSATVSWLPPPTTTTMTSSPLSGTIGTPINLVATVTSSAGVLNGGTVSFYTVSGNTLLGTANVVAGTATLSAGVLPAGISSFYAVFAGSIQAATSTSSIDYVFVGPQTSTSLAVSTNTAVSGTPIVLTATGLNIPGNTSLTPGTVTFNYVETLGSYTYPGTFGTVQMTAAGTAVLSVVPNVGSYIITALFSGTSLGGPSVSAPQAVTITANASYVTGTNLQQAGVPGNYQLYATVTGYGLQAPAGIVTFLNTTTPGTVATASLDPTTNGSYVGALTNFNAPTATLTNDPHVTWVAAGDLNNDGIADLISVTANGTNGKVIVQLGNGDGTFQTGIATAPFHQLNQAIVGDFNNDGKLDVATLSVASDAIDVYLGNGDGTLAPVSNPGPQSLFTNDQPISIVTGDFNNDGNLDIAVLAGSQNAVWVYLGAGDGTFTKHATATGSNVVNFVSGDFNGDGKLDVIVGNSAGTFTTYLGNGDGTFGAGSSSFLMMDGGPPGFVLTGSLRHNGILDLLIVDPNNAVNYQNLIYLGKGDGTFSATPLVQVTSNQTMSGTLVDLDRDGNLDLAANDGYEMSIFYGVGDGTFGSENDIGTNNSLNVAAADFNHDGLPDLITADAGGTSTLLLGYEYVSATANNVYALGTGPQAVTANYPGDAVHALSISLPVNLDPSVQSPSTTLLAASATTLLQGASVTFTATVTPTPAGASFGTISFYNNGALLVTEPVPAGGVATYTTLALPAGSNAITAIYSGNAGLAVSNAPAVTVAVFLVTTTTLTASLPGSNAGQPVTLTATVAPTPTGSPLGTIIFFAGTTQVGSGTLNAGGVATVTLASLPAGVLSLTAAYGGNATYASSTSAGVAFTVAALTSTTVTASTLTPGYGQAFTVTATIVPASTAVPPGTVSFYNGTTLLGTTAVNAAGVATFSVSGLNVGVASITAVFSGSAGFSGSASAALAVTVVPVTTATALAASNLTPVFGQAITLTATVAPAPTDAARGSVKFYSGTTLLGTAAVNAAGVATLNAVLLPVGPGTVQATYTGSVNFTGSASAALSVSARAASGVSLSASPATQLFNNPIMLTAQVSSTAPGAPSGTVTVLDGTSAVCTVPVSASGQSVCTSTGLAAGMHTLSATYSGDPQFLASASTGAPIAVTVADLNLALGNDNNKTVRSGDPVTYNFPLSPLVTPTFLYDVALTASGLPPGATYTFSPAKIPAGSGTLPVAFTVHTAAPGTAALRVTPTGSATRWATLAVLFLLPLTATRRFRARLKSLPGPLFILLAGILSLGLATGLSGCGAGGFFGDPLHGKSYTITVKATSADLVRTSTVQLNFE